MKIHTCSLFKFHACNTVKCTWISYETNFYKNYQICWNFSISTLSILQHAFYPLFASIFLSKLFFSNFAFQIYIPFEIIYPKTDYFHFFGRSVPPNLLNLIFCFCKREFKPSMTFKEERGGVEKHDISNWDLDADLCNDWLCHLKLIFYNSLPCCLSCS